MPAKPKIGFPSCAEVRRHDGVDLDVEQRCGCLRSTQNVHMPQGGAPGDDHVVARLDVGDALAHLGDDAGALVAEHARGRRGIVPFMPERSEWHTPVAAILTFTSPGPTGAQLDVVAGSRACRHRC